MPDKGRKRKYDRLKKLANSGNWKSYQREFDKSKINTCYGPCKEHRKIHTIPAHCTVHCGGNNGIIKGPCYEMCKGGMHIGRLVEEGWNRFTGQPFQPGPGSYDAKAATGKSKMSLHELRIGKVAKQEYKDPETDKPLRVSRLPLGKGETGKNSYLNWLALQVIREGTNPAYHGGASVFRNRGKQHTRNLLQNLIDGKFAPSESNPEKGIDDEGMRYLNSLPLTPWQRCFLWHPYGVKRCDSASKKSMSDFKRANWAKSPLFEMVLKHPTVSSYLSGYRDYWKLECGANPTAREYIWFVPIPFTKRNKPKYNCKEISKEKAKAANEAYRKGTSASKDKNLKDSGDAIAQAVGPIVGKILGMLLKAAGMYQMMKTLARAAGLTPEQSADCEDSEYRHEVMKLKKCSAAEIKNASCQDTKRGCLLKVFAKNFGTVLESIIVMLGNKLVDWGVDLLRNVLQVVKSAILSALASVPYAGGVLATVFDIAWELLLNYGAKMLLKGFVVAKLPEWLKIRELAKQAMDKLMEHPIVRTIAGIILQLIDAAMVHGEKSWMAVGVDSAISGIQLLLQNIKPTPYFWIRALHFAKREMAKNATADGSITEQLRRLAQAMIGGFGAAIGRGIKDETVRSSFETAVDEIKGLLDPGKADNLIAGFSKGPIQFLTDLIAKKIGPVVMPILTTFVPMDRWVKGLLLRLGSGIATTVDELQKGQIDGKTLVARIVEVFEPQGKDCEERVFCRLLRQIPAGPALKKLLEKGFTKLTDLLRDIDQIPGYLSKPWEVVSGVVDLVGGFLKEKVEDLFAGIGIEKKLVTGALDTLLSILTDEKTRERLFGSRPDPAALLAKLAEAVKPYAVERLKDLARGTGLESLIGAAVEVFFGPQGPLVRGAAFFSDLPAQLRRHGPAVAAQALEAVSGIVQAQAARAGGPVLGGLAKGILGTLAKAMKAPGGLASLFKGGAADVLKLVKDALLPLVDALAPTKGKGGVVQGLLRSVLRGVLDLFGNPGSLRQLAKRGAGALKSLATQVAGALQGALKSLITQLVPDPALKALAASGVDGFFELLSDPAKMAKATGTKVLELLKAAGRRIFGFVKTKLAALAGEAGGASAKAVVLAIAGQLEQVIADPSKLKTLVEGNAKALISGLAAMLGKAVQGLVDSAVPGAVKPVLKQIVAEAVGFFSNPTKLGQLGSMNASQLLQKVAPVAKGILEGILKSVVPAGTWTALQGAIAKVQAALQNPAGLAAQAGAAAKQAVDQVIAAAVFRIPDPGLRELASGLVALVGDLVAGDAKATKLRGDAKAILGRLVSAGGRYLATLVPPGPVQEILTRAMEGLKGVLAGSGGAGASLAQKAAALLPGIKDALVGFLQNLLQRAIPDSRISLLVSGLVREVVTLVTEPKAWSELKKQGATGLLARLVPAVRGFVLSLVGGLSGGLAELRPIVEGLFDALKDAKSIGRFSQGSVSALVSLGVSAISPVVLRLVERATGSSGIAAFLKEALAKLGAFLSQPTELAAFLKKNASQAFGTLLEAAQKLAEGLVDSVVRDSALKKLAKEGLKGVLAFIQRAAAGGDAASAAKAILAKLIPAVAGLLKAKLVGVIPARMGALKTLVTKGFDKLTTLATGIVTEGKAAFEKLISGGAGKLVGGLVGEVVSLLKPPLQRAISHRGLASLVTGLLDALPRVLANPGKLRGMAGVKIVLGEVGTVLEGFLQRTIVSRLPRGMAQDVVGTVIREGVALLKDPQRLKSFIDKAKSGKGLVQEIIGGIASRLKGAIKGGLGEIVEKGLKVLVETVTARR